ncbi:MAG: molybdenum cofactor biosynthesis protein MoaE [Actinomycetota bacterium]|nr:molybdenum cofactor biosynthesis protein MoaE [Actinomycetota bacterium]
MTIPHEPTDAASGEIAGGRPRVTVMLTRERIGLDEAYEAVAHPESGGVGAFGGAVRNHHDGVTVQSITYEAWEGRAAPAMRDAAAEVIEAFPAVRAVYIAHRIGSLAVGDLSVVVAASAPHRDEAFGAARMLIDLVKTSVPIWKHEHLADGTSRWPGA